MTLLGDIVDGAYRDEPQAVQDELRALANDRRLDEEQRAFRVPAVLAGRTLAELDREARLDRGDAVSADERAVLRAASSVEVKPQRWIWAGRIPAGGTCIAVGNPGLGKSVLFDAWIAARVTRGQLPGDLRGQPADVIIASAEDSIERTLVPRLMAAGADLDRVHFITIRREDFEDGIVLPHDVAAVTDAVRRTGAALVILDPLMAHVDGAVDSHKDHHVRRMLTPLARLADDSEIAVLAIVHLNKSAAGDIFTRTGGSIGITAAARSVLVVARDPEDEDRRVLLVAKNNLAPDDPAGQRFAVESCPIPDEHRTNDVTSAAGIVWLGDADVTVEDVLTAPVRERSAPKLEAAKAMLMEALVDGPLSVDALRAEAGRRGIGWRTVQDAKRDLQVVVEQDRTRDGALPATWRLPDQGGSEPGWQTPVPHEIANLAPADSPTAATEDEPDEARLAAWQLTGEDVANRAHPGADDPSGEAVFDESDPSRPEHRPSRRDPALEELLEHLEAGVAENVAAVDQMLSVAEPDDPTRWTR